MACSRFRADSEITRLHRAAGRPTVASSLLVEVLAASLRVARLTGGAVDPTVGRAVRDLGYDRDLAEVLGRSHAAAGPARPAPGWWRIGVDESARTVVIPRDIEVDLGSVGKAFAADRAAHDLADLLGCGVLVSLGGDIAVAGEAPEGGWLVRVREAHDAPEGSPGPAVTISSGGLATSSTVRRTWRQGTRQVHHIVDPGTGDIPAPVWRTVTAAAATCTDANAASTAAIVLAGAAPAWLQDRGLPARLVSVTGAVTTTAGWPADDPGARLMGQALWYASRGTGLVSLLLVTAATVVGILSSSRVATPRWPRSVVASLHRNLSLLTLVLLAVHISTAIIDPYAGIRWLDAVVPFFSVYQPFWLGLGAVALDLMLAVIVTSLLRTRLSLSTWRAVHLTSYAMWPLVLLHGLGNGGTDRHQLWVLSLYVGCALAVVAAAIRRLTAVHQDTEMRTVDAARWR